MNLLPLQVPPGMFRNGTEYQSKGRWYEGNLVRWVTGVMQAVGGWIGFGRGFAQETNVLLRSYQLGTSPWSTGAGVVTADETTISHYDETGLTLRSTKLTDDGSDAAAHKTQTVGVLTANPETLSVVIEKISGATVTDIEIRDTTADAAVVRVRITWSTLAVAVDNSANGTDDSVELRKMGTGPYGGTLVRLIATATPTVPGNDRAVRIYPTGIINAEAGVIVVHHAQLREAASAGGIVFTTTVSVTQPANRVTVDSPISGMRAWRDNSGGQHLAIGTTCQAWHYTEGVLEDISPSGFVCGGAVSTTQSGIYGAGAYGAGVYGGGDSSIEALVEAQAWQFDTWGEYLLGLAYSDGKLYEYQLTGSFTAVTNAPVDNLGMLVTNERIVMLLGAGGDARKVQWSDQEDNTEWTPSDDNQAGDFILPGDGECMMGLRGRSESLIWTTTDLFGAQYIGGDLIYSIRQRGTNCGPISRRAAVMIDGQRAVWMGIRSFFIYDGAVRPVPSDVEDYVFSDINRQQSSLISVTPISAVGEVTWYYPSAASTFPDRYVTWNIKDGTWYFGTLARTAGLDRGIFPFPLQGDRFGVVYEHERGDEYKDYLGTDFTPNARSGPVEVGPGEKVVFVRNIIPDENTQGGVSITLGARFYPNAADHSTIEYTPANPTNTRITGRQFSVQIEQVTPGWRFGIPRFDVEVGGSR